MGVQKRLAPSPTGTAESYFLHLHPWELRTEIFDMWIHLALGGNGTRWATQHRWWLLLVQMQQWTFSNHINVATKNRGSSAPKPKGLLPLDLLTGMQALVGQCQELASVSGYTYWYPSKGRSLSRLSLEKFWCTLWQGPGYLKTNKNQ